MARRFDYAGNPLLFYPGGNLSAEEKRRMDAFAVGIEELTVDHLIYGMSRQIENNFQTFFAVANDLLGEAQTLKVANEIGRRYGGRNYASLQNARGLGNRGSPEIMARYQDLAHAIRGPKHAAALFAEYDEKRCTARRNACIYYSDAFPDNGKYTSAFEQGVYEGYLGVDQNLRRVDNPKCVCRGDRTCEHHFIYQE
jgi:hypothetical protein